MSDDNELRRDRDRTLPDAYYTYGWGLRTLLSNWIEEEAYHAESMLETLEMLSSDVPEEVRAMLRDKRQRVGEIRTRERKEAEEWMKKKCTDIREEIYDDPLEARIYIDEAIWRYENAMRTLLHVRKFMDAYGVQLGEGDDAEDAEDDE